MWFLNSLNNMSYIPFSFSEIKFLRVKKKSDSHNGVAAQQFGFNNLCSPDMPQQAVSPLGDAWRQNADSIAAPLKGC